jgi:molybdate transport system ATP-binding protein
MSFDVALALTRGDRTITAAVASDVAATVLFGPSGAGKTSVLLAIAGLLRPAGGHVRVAGDTLFDLAAGVDVAPERRRAGMVFQDGRLFPHLSVRANLLYGAPDRAALDEVAELLGLRALLGRWPRTLSGGEARRVALGRALLRDPAFLLLDEPTASLDRARREEVLALVERVRDERRLPILMVTHDPAEAERIGRVVAIGD